jgi:hypothetical protein
MKQVYTVQALALRLGEEFTCVDHIYGCWFVAGHGRLRCVLHPGATRDEGRSVSGASLRVKPLPIANFQLPICIKRFGNQEMDDNSQSAIAIGNWQLEITSWKPFLETFAMESEVC